MTRVAYVEKNFRPDALKIIAKADEIMRAYAAQGFALTLRQLYYQFVARGIIPNKQTEYKRLGSIINDARLAGLLDWDNIEDRTRNLEELATWGKPNDIIQACAEQFRVDMWAGQDERPEVWIEKEALSGVVQPTCEANRVAYFACRGYTSQSEAWRAGMRIVNRYRRTKQHTMILHLGDHDPSGIDMTRDNRDRLTLFCEHHLGHAPFTLKRLALNMDQVEEYQPPPNPAKLTDSRAEDYISRFGDESWELDALDPATIADLLQRNIDRARSDEDKWLEREQEETDARKNISLISDRYDDVVEWLEEV